MAKVQNQCVCMSHEWQAKITRSHHHPFPLEENILMVNLYNRTAKLIVVEKNGKKKKFSTSA